MVATVAPEHADATTILGLLPHGVLVVARDWRVVYANPEAGRLLGNGAGTLWERCPALEHTAFASGFRYAMSDRTELLTESALPTVGWCQARARPTPEGGLLISLRQINAHTIETGQAKTALLIGEIGDALTREESLTAALDRCAGALIRHLDGAHARIWIVEPCGTRLRLAAHAGVDSPLPADATLALGEQKIGQIAEDGEPYLTNDVATDVHVGRTDWIARERIASFAGYPLRIEDRIVGVMSMYSRRKLDHDTLNGLSAIVDALALGIARKSADAARRRAEEELREKAGHLEVLHELGKQLAAVLEPDALTQRVIDAATRLANAQIGAFFYTGPDGPRFALSGISREAFAGLGMPRPTAILGPALGGQGVVRRGDVRVDTEYGKTGPHFGVPEHHPKVASFLGVPVIGRRGKTIGALLLGHERPDMFGEETERLILGVASTAAMSLDNAKLFEDARLLIAALEKSNRELDQFAYVASHDLKAPLRGIANLSQWIEEDLGDRLDDQTREHMTLLRGRVIRLENLIGGILAYARAGREKGEQVDVDVRTIVSEAWELLAPPETAKLVVATDLPRLATSRIQLQQVLLNLIGNAIKYNPTRPLTITVSARRDGRFWELSVADDGVGIAPEFHDRIWALFQTLERRDKLESTGIGLSVVRKIVEAHGGKAWVTSQLGAGATFTFTWPVEESAHG